MQPEINKEELLTKKSAKGLLGVYYDDYMNLTLYDQLDWTQENGGELKTVFKDGKFTSLTTIDKIRLKLNEQ